MQKNNLPLLSYTLVKFDMTGTTPPMELNPNLSLGYGFECIHLLSGTSFIACIQTWGGVIKDVSSLASNYDLIEQNSNLDTPSLPFATPENVEYMVMATYSGGAGRYKQVNLYSLIVIFEVTPDINFTAGVSEIRGTMFIVGQLRTTQVQVTKHDDLTMIKRYQGGGGSGIGITIIKDSNVIIHGGYD